VDPDERRVRTDLARALSERWGCPAAGHALPARLPPSLAAETEAVAEITRTPCARTCPFARVYALGPWEHQLFKVRRLARESSPLLVFRAVTGRDPHRWDLDGLDVIESAGLERRESDDEIRDAERKANAPKP
jgi:hypothetical protein